MLLLAWIPVAGALAYVADDDVGARLVAAVLHEPAPPPRPWKGCRLDRLYRAPPRPPPPTTPTIVVRMTPSAWVPHAHDGRYCSVAHTPGRG